MVIRIIVFLLLAVRTFADKMDDFLIGRTIAPYSGLLYSFNAEAIVPSEYCSDLLTVDNGSTITVQNGEMVFFTGAPQNPSGTPPVASASGWVPVSGASPWWEYDGTAWQFTVTPKMATRIYSIQYWGRRSTQGPTSWRLYWSVDGYASPISVTDASTASYVNTGVLITAKVPASRGAAPITFRLIGYDATSEGGAWRVDDVRVRFSDIQGSKLCD